MKNFPVFLCFSLISNSKTLVVRFSGIALFIASKAEALINGRTYVTPNDVKNIAPDVLRHRILLNYEALAEGTSTDEIIVQILSKVPMY